MQLPIQRIDSSKAWLGKDLVRNGAWISDLTVEEVSALAEVAMQLGDDPSTWLEFSPEPESLGAFGARMSELGKELDDGRGFLLIRGIAADIPLLELKKRYWVLGRQLGQIVPQNMAGELMGSVTDKGSRYLSDVNARGYTSNDELFFHSDAGDAVSLMCVRQARNGGGNAIVSTMALYNMFLEEAPELLPVLSRGFPIYIRNEGQSASVGGVEAGVVTARRYPVFIWHDGYLSGGINLKSVRATTNFTGKPFSEEEEKVLQMIESFVDREGVRLDLQMQPGDVLVVNNYLILHKRYGFEDYPDPERKRLLLRFWINLNNPRPLPEDIAVTMRAGFEATPVLEGA